MMSYNHNLFFRIKKTLFHLRKYNISFKKSFVYLFLVLSVPFSYLLFKQGPRLINRAQTPSTIDRYRSFNSRTSKTAADYFGRELGAQGEGEDDWYDHGFGNGRIKYNVYALVPKDYLVRRRGSTLTDTEIAARLTPSIQWIVNGYKKNLQIELQVEPIQVRHLPNTLEEVVCGTDAWCENPNWDAYNNYITNFSNSNLNGSNREISVNTLLVFGGAGIAYDAWQSHIFVGDWGFSSLFDYYWSDCGGNCDASGFEGTLAHEIGHSLGLRWHSPSYVGQSIMGSITNITLANHEGYPERYLACLSSLNHGPKNCDQFQKPNRPPINLTNISGKIMTACDQYKISTMVAFSKNSRGFGNRTIVTSGNLNSDGTFTINANMITRAWERGYGINLFLNNSVDLRDFNDLEQIWQHTDKPGHYHFTSSGKLCADDFEYCVDGIQFLVQPRSVQPSALCGVDPTRIPPTPTPACVTSMSYLTAERIGSTNAIKLSAAYMAGNESSFTIQRKYGESLMLFHGNPWDWFDDIDAQPDTFTYIDTNAGIVPPDRNCYQYEITAHNSNSSCPDKYKESNIVCPGSNPVQTPTPIRPVLVTNTPRPPAPTSIPSRTPTTIPKPTVVPSANSVVFNTWLHIFGQGWLFSSNINPASTGSRNLSSLQITAKADYASACWYQPISGSKISGKKVRLTAEIMSNPTPLNFAPYIALNIQRSDQSWMYNFGGTVSLNKFTKEVNKYTVIASTNEIIVPGNVTAGQINFCLWKAPVNFSAEATNINLLVY